MEVRLYAEDPRTFLPQAGRIERLRLPTGIRVDAGVDEGDEVGVAYDPMIAKLIAHGPTRDEALLRLRDALAETAVEGLTTNLPFLRWLVAHPAVRAGRTTTAFLSEYAPLSAPPTRLPSGPWDGAWRMNLPPPAPHTPPDVDELSHAAAGPSGGAQSALTAPMPGTVIKVLAAPGDKVEQRQTLLVLEAMKMETPVVSPYAGGRARPCTSPRETGSPAARSWSSSRSRATRRPTVAPGLRTSRAATRTAALIRATTSDQPSSNDGFTAMSKMIRKRITRSIRESTISRLMRACVTGESAPSASTHLLDTTALEDEERNPGQERQREEHRARSGSSRRRSSRTTRPRQASRPVITATEARPSGQPHADPLGVAGKGREALTAAGTRIACEARKKSIIEGQPDGHAPSLGRPC